MAVTAAVLQRPAAALTTWATIQPETTQSETATGNFQKPAVRTFRSHMLFASALRDFHDSFSWFVIVANGLAGIWALLAHWNEGLRQRSLWWFIAVAQTLVFVQIAGGIAIVAGEGVEVDGFHLFYGGLCVLSVGILYSYRQQLVKWRFLLYGIGGLFIMGLATRALSVAG